MYDSGKVVFTLIWWALNYQPSKSSFPNRHLADFWTGLLKLHTRYVIKITPFRNDSDWEEMLSSSSSVLHNCLCLSLQVTFTAWDSDQPDNYGTDGQDCAGMRHVNGLWNDWNCESNFFPYICEKKGIHAPLLFVIINKPCLISILPLNSCINDVEQRCKLLPSPPPPAQERGKRGIE